MKPIGARKKSDKGIRITVTSPFIYDLYYNIRAYHQRHRLQSIGWTAHQRVTEHISTGYEPKSSGSGGGAIR